MLKPFASFFIRTIAASVMPLAAGALWSALSRQWSADLPACALLCAASLWFVENQLRSAYTLLRMLQAVICCSIGLAYAYWLKSALVVSQFVGTSFLDALRHMDADFSYAVAKAHAAAGTNAFLISALLLAAWIGWRAGVPAATEEFEPRE